MTYKLTIRETFEHTHRIEAESEAEAREKWEHVVVADYSGYREDATERVITALRVIEAGAKSYYCSSCDADCDDETCRGSRYRATDCDGKRAYSPNHLELNSDENHDEAARALCRKLGLKGKLVRGNLARGQQVYVWLKDWSVLDVDA